MSLKPADPSILIVDDDQATIDMLSMLLTKNGYQVGTASNGKEALHYLKAKTYDIIVTDLKMPDIDGYQLLDIVKTSYRGHKVLVMTADLFKKDRLLRKGAMEAVGKPFNLKGLIEEIKKLLQERRRTKRFSSQQKVFCRIKDRQGRELTEAMLNDISIDGVLLKVAHPIDDANELVVEFYRPPETRIGTVGGKVVRLTKDQDPDHTHVAVYFDDERDLTLLEKLGQAISAKSAAEAAGE
jgi:CheY-like chemotaxis protein